MTALTNVRVPIASLEPRFAFKLGGNPDWLKVTRSAVWVSNAKLSALHRIDPRSNEVVATIALPSPPCAGLAAGLRSVWVTLCGATPALARIDTKTNAVNGWLHVGPVDPEGGIAVDDEGVWMLIDRHGTLVRIDPTTGSIARRISLDPGSSNAMSIGGLIWVTGRRANRLIAVRASNGRVVSSTAVGPKPRFLAYGDGSIWTLNQGNGTVSRVDATTKKLIATIGVGTRGSGGGICFGGGSVWTSFFGVPLTRIDPRTNSVVRQWVGRGGDSVAFGHNSLWVTDFPDGLLWRIPLAVARAKSA